MKASQFRKRAKASRAELITRVQESIENSSGFPSVIDKDIAKKLSGREVPIWKPKEGIHIIDILPFFSGKKNSIAEDQFAYVRQFHVHYNIGPSEENFVCPANTKVYNKKQNKAVSIGPCPICEYIKKNDLKNTDEALFNSIKARNRTLHLVWVHSDSQQEEAGVQILDFAHWFLEKKLSEISKNPRTGGLIAFSDLDVGKSIIFEKTGSGIGTKVFGHRFDERPEPLPDDIVDQIFPLDEVLKMPPSYAVIKEAFYQGVPSEDAEVEDEEYPEDIPYGSEEEEALADDDEYEDDDDAADADDAPPFDEDDEDEEYPEEIEDVRHPEPEPESDSTTRRRKKRSAPKPAPEEREQKSPAPRRQPRSRRRK